MMDGFNVTQLPDGKYQAVVNSTTKTFDDFSEAINWAISETYGIAEDSVETT